MRPSAGDSSSVENALKGLCKSAVARFTVAQACDLWIRGGLGIARCWAELPKQKTELFDVLGKLSKRFFGCFQGFKGFGFEMLLGIELGVAGVAVSLRCLDQIGYCIVAGSMRQHCRAIARVF